MYHELGEKARRLDEDPMVLIERFHGHVGPYVVLGYVSGRLAQERLDANAFRLTAEVYAGSRPPMSCFKLLRFIRNKNFSTPTRLSSMIRN